MNKFEKTVELLVNLIESKVQGEHDFCGEQRAWHLPRLRQAFVLACQLFPLEMVEATRRAKTPCGNNVVS